MRCARRSRATSKWRAGSSARERSRRRARRRRRLRDPRLWLGIAITAATLALAARGVDFRTLLHDLSRADLPLLVGSLVPDPSADALGARAALAPSDQRRSAPTTRGALFRATAVGALANNVFPLRIGEVVRAFYLARETRAGTAAIFGTVVLERGIDGVAVVALALVIFGARGGPDAGALAVGAPAAGGRRAAARRGSCGSASRPSRWCASMRVALGMARGRAWPAPVERLIRRMAEGLGSLQGGRHLWWVAWHSVVIWTVLGIAPFLIAMRGARHRPRLAVERTLSAGFVTLTAVGDRGRVALGARLPRALPPGRARGAAALRGRPRSSPWRSGRSPTPSSGSPRTGVGLAVLRCRGTRLDELADAASVDADQVPSQRRR